MVAKFARRKITDLRELNFVAQNAAAVKLKDSFTLCEFFNAQIKRTNFHVSSNLNDLTGFAFFFATIGEARPEVWDKLATNAIRIIKNFEFPENFQVKSGIFFFCQFVRKTKTCVTSHEIGSVLAPHVTREAEKIESEILLNYFQACAQSEFREESNLREIVAIFRRRKIFSNLEENEKTLRRLFHDAKLLGVRIPELDEIFETEKTDLLNSWFRKKNIYKPKKMKISSRRLRKM